MPNAIWAYLMGRRREVNLLRSLKVNNGCMGFVPDEIRGRIAGVYDMHVGGTMALANLTNGGLTELLNAPLVLVAGGVILIIVIFSSIGLAPLRRIYFPRVSPTSSFA